MSILRIIFILSNIYENINGVSTKYSNFIDYLSSINYLNSKIDITILIPGEGAYEKDNIHLVKVRSIKIPFYKDIKVPIISKTILLNQIKTGKEIFIFNGEFFWLYNKFKRIQKKHPKIKIFPTMHTNYDFYTNYIYTFLNFGFKPIKNHLDYYLEKKIFEGIIVTGENMIEKYKNVTNNIFNANEVNLSVFKSFKIDNYNISNNNPINFIYCGRISKEKNLDELIDCFNSCFTNSSNHFILNIIGDGPYIEEFKNNIIKNHSDIVNKICFHGALTQKEIVDLYNELDNRIFLFTSISETFAKTPMEAGATGILIFIKKNSDNIYDDNINAILFNNKNDFNKRLNDFLSKSIDDKKRLIELSLINIKKYDQSLVFPNMFKFIVQSDSKMKVLLNFLDIFSFSAMSKIIRCSSAFIGEDD